MRDSACRRRRLIRGSAVGGVAAPRRPVPWGEWVARRARIPRGVKGARV
ncbi:MAG: hypothetical protein N0E59_02230 [Candidatus Thiodiazotropha taylori]|nr:hypothetical protein [Candidatus Thiodiazotropha taylori]MCW4281901.1 hypothetical protein [Candidatus Thiodiazotropha taylori]